MQIYLPIAEVSVNAFLLLGIGGIVGILSGMFGVGGGFLMTPLLFFIGIPPAVAVATGANQIVASSVSGLMAHLKRKTVDLKMGTVLLLGGLGGVAVGVLVFNFLKSLGQVDLFVTLCYVVFLGIIGGLMFGAGMVLARGCSGRLLVLAATGNLRSVVSGLIFAVVAQMSLSGWLSPLRDRLAALWITSGGRNLNLEAAVGLLKMLALRSSL